MSLTDTTPDRATARQAEAARLMLEIAQALAFAADHRENLPDKALIPVTLGQARQVRHALRVMAAESREAPGNG